MKNSQHRLPITAISAFLAVGAVAACSDPFTTCEATRTCPSKGQGGAGGNAGAGGTASAGRSPNVNSPSGGSHSAQSGAGNVSGEGGGGDPDHASGGGLGSGEASGLGGDAGSLAGGGSGGAITVISAGAGGEAGDGTSGACPIATGGPGSCTAECPCSAGQGQCATDHDCAAELICARSIGKKFGFQGNACIPTHCDNDVQDADETSIDCGGSCGCLAEVTWIPKLNRVTGVSSDGSVVVGVGSNANGLGRAYRWTEGGRLEELNILPNLNMVPFDVSSDGTVIVGGAGDLLTNVSGGFRWSEGAPTTDLLPQGLIAVSGDGRVSLASGFLRCLESECNAATSSHSNCAFHDLSYDGSVMVGDCNGSPVVWTTAEAELPLDPTALYAAANAVSYDGRTIVGYAELSESERQAYVWSRTANGSYSPRGLGDLPGGIVTASATGVSRDGGIVIGRGTTESGEQPFIWSAKGGMRSLVDELTARGYEWPVKTGRLTANAISADGTAIVGEDQGTGGALEAWRIRLH